MMNHFQVPKELLQATAFVVMPQGMPPAPQHYAAIKLAQEQGFVEQDLGGMFRVTTQGIELLALEVLTTLSAQ